MEPNVLADAARQLGMRVEIAASVDAALKSVAKLAYEVPPRILITGGRRGFLVALAPEVCVRLLGAAPVSCALAE